MTNFTILTLLLILSIITNSSIAQSEADPKFTHTQSVKTASMGMGLNGISDWSTQMPFLDLMKQSRDWNDWRDTNKTRPPIQTNEHDWVKKLLPGQTAGTVFLVSPRDRDPIYSEYIVNFEGEGEIEYRWATKFQAKASKPGHHIIRVGQGNNLIEIVSTNPQNPIRNISIVPKKHYQAFKNGAIFNPDWLQLIEQFNTLRYMDWLKTNNSKLSKWADRALISDRTWQKNGVPFEVIIRLAKETNTNLWVNIPHLANDDFIKNLANLFRDMTPKYLDIYIEHSNEVWNWQFTQAHYANQQGRALFGEIGPAFMRWHGMRTAQICDIFKTGAFSDSPRQIHCVLGVQTAWHGLEKEALLCDGWKSDNNGPCYKHGFDHIAITTYFNGKLHGPQKQKKNTDNTYKDTLIEWSTSSTGLKKAFEQLHTGAPLSSIPDLTNYKGAINDLEEQFMYWRGIADQYSLGLVAYEGGQHITANGRALQDNKSVTQLYEQINESPEIADIYTQLFKTWKKYGGLHMHFVDVSGSSKWGSWGARKYLDQSAPKWDAIESFNQDTACWWQACEISPNSQNTGETPRVNLNIPKVN